MTIDIAQPRRDGKYPVTTKPIPMKYKIQMVSPNGWTDLKFPFYTVEEFASKKEAMQEITDIVIAFDGKFDEYRVVPFDTPQDDESMNEYYFITDSPTGFGWFAVWKQVGAQQRCLGSFRCRQEAEEYLQHLKSKL